MFAAANSRAEIGLAAQRHRQPRLRVSVSAEPRFRSELERVLRKDGRFDVLTGEGGVTANVAGSEPDVLLAEVSDDDSLRRVEQARAAKLVLLADAVTRTELLRRCGERLAGLLPRSASGHQICAALEAATFDLITFTANDWHIIAPDADADDEDELAVEALTPREAEVLALMAKGLSNKTIADRLQISGHTAKFHVSSILGKLQATSRTEAVTKGLRGGLLVV